MSLSQGFPRFVIVEHGVVHFAMGGFIESRQGLLC